MRHPKLNRVGRLLIGLLGPAIIASFILMLYVFVSAGIKEGPSLESFYTVVKGFIIFLVAGLFFIGLQSLVYSIVMEFIVRPKVRRRYAFLLTSCFLGAASGSIVSIIFDDLQLFIALGAVTGLLTGLILYDKHMQSSHSKDIPDGPRATRRVVDR